MRQLGYKTYRQKKCQSVAKEKKFVAREVNLHRRIANPEFNRRPARAVEPF